YHADLGGRADAGDRGQAGGRGDAGEDTTGVFCRSGRFDDSQRFGGPGGGLGRLLVRESPAAASLVCRASSHPWHGPAGLCDARAGGDSVRHLPGAAGVAAGPGGSAEVRMIGHIFREALGALAHYRLRSALTMLSITWG